MEEAVAWLAETCAIGGLYLPRAATTASVRLRPRAVARRGERDDAAPPG